jgi:elongation factor Ts
LNNLDITAEMVKNLRVQTGAGVMSCRSALIESQGDVDKAIELLKEQNLLQVEKKSNRKTSQGSVASYVHAGGRIGVIIEVNCETDFVARTDEFKELIHNLAMQVAAMSPLCINKEDIPADAEAEPETASLLLQPYIKDTTRTVQDIINETIAKTGENIRVKRFTRYELGEETE